MKKLFVLFSLATLLSCSGEFHLKRAIKKGAITEKVRVDTLIVDTTLVFTLPPDTTVKRYVIDCSTGKPQLALHDVGKQGQRSNVTAKIVNDTLYIEATCDSVNEELHLYKELYSQCVTYECDCFITNSQVKKWGWWLFGILFVVVVVWFLRLLMFP